MDPVPRPCRDPQHVHACLRACKAFIFDMDGTLVTSSLDFKAMREALTRGVGVGEDGKYDVLLELEKIDVERKRRALEIIRDMEVEAAEGMAFLPGAVELMRELDEKGVKRALLTRNCEDAVRIFDALAGAEPHALPRMSVAVSRDTLPLASVKPKPDGILHICEQWGLAPKDVAMVGDSLSNDIQSGINAGSLTVHVGPHRANSTIIPDIRVDSLDELRALLSSSSSPEAS